jgi:hypothetical protein
MLSPATSPTVDPLELESAIAAQKGAIAEIERELWDGGFDEDVLDTYQGAYRRLEALYEKWGQAGRHKFVIVIPVADRPQQLRDCLQSLLELCAAYGYGGMEQGVYRKVAVVIADDSADAASIDAHRELAREFSAAGIATRHFGPAEQCALLDTLAPAERERLSRVLGASRAGTFGHKGQAAMRNIAYLELAALAGQAARAQPAEPLLFYSIDSDQEFKVKLSTAAGDREAYAVNFLYWLNEIFSRTEASVLTGKVVGDPPVSPAVMAGNFLEDVIAFLQQMSASGGQTICQNHQADVHRQGEAAYHDMAELFGFQQASEAYRYLCPLEGEHGDADCFDHFAGRLASFFFGEHPTRVSYYQHASIARTVMPARTVYAGNYVFRPEALRHFIPFAALRLRMSGPTLGRLIKSELGARFVSANLPMLHKRTFGGSGQSEFRPGVRADEAAVIDLCDEAERQFFGDVMLFTVERLTALGYPRQVLPEEMLASTLATVHDEMMARYAAKRSDILAKLGRLREVLDDPAQWWNRDPGHGNAVAKFAAFAANIERNFGMGSACFGRIESPQNWQKWREVLLGALVAHPEDARRWAETVASRLPGA